MKEKLDTTWPPRCRSLEEAFSEIFSSGDWWKYTGERVRKLEREFPGSHQSRFGVSVCNGSLAIDIALKALDVKPGDEVILPAYDFYSLPKSVLNVGATPVFVDVTASNLTMDKKEVEKKINSRTRAVVAVHISGSVAELDALSQIAKEHNVCLVEDCAQAHGAIYDGKKVGSWGDLAIFSFGGVKLMTCGQGGIIITSDEELYSRCYAITNRGHLPDGTMNPYRIIGENYQMSELQAAILLPQIGLLESYSRRREKACALLDLELSEIDDIDVLSQFPKTQRRAHMRYSFYCQSQLPKRVLIERLRQAGIPAMPGYSSARTDPRLQKAFADQGDDFPNSKAAEEEIVGIHHIFLLNERQVLIGLAKIIRENLTKS